MFNNVKVEFHLICSALVDVLKTGNPSDKFFEKLTHFLR
jgi:hypothetical protein